MNHPFHDQIRLKRSAFEKYLRTGRISISESIYELKFNPYHDPRNGRFTFAPGGGSSSSSSGLNSKLRNPAPRRVSKENFDPQDQEDQRSNISTLLDKDEIDNDRNSSRTSLVQYSPNPRARMGSNSGSPPDPLTISQVFPRLDETPAGGIVAIADNIFDFSGPARQLTTDLAEEHVNLLMSQIRQISPNYRLDSFGFPQTAEGQFNLIRQLQTTRATLLFEKKGEIRPLQVETLRIMQDSADRAYEDAVKLDRAGRLTQKLSRNEAIGNYIDRAVRGDLRAFYRQMGIDTAKGREIRVVGREYDSSGSDLTFRIPDARVGKVAFDVTLARKTASTPQVRGFFASDFRPSAVVIIRPKQIGSGNTYAISRGGK